MVTVEEKLYNKMPDEIKSCFKMLPNPGSDEVVDLFPSPHGAGFKRGGGLSKEGNSMFCGNHEGNGARFGDSGSAARFFYCAKASKSERNRGCEDIPEKRVNYMAKANGTGEPSMDTFSSMNRNNHPTVKPIALMEYLIKLVSREGHTILDPFLGSGTTGIACKKLNRHFIGIEKELEYIKIAEARMNSVETQQKLI